MIKVLFVCHGNICRSAMAEMMMKDLVARRHETEQWLIDSAGTSDEEHGADIYPPAKRTLQRYGVAVIPHRAKQLRRTMADDYDWFVCMSDVNVERSIRILGEQSADRVIRLMDLTDDRRDISDPWYSGDFETTYADLEKGLAALYSFAKSVSVR